MGRFVWVGLLLLLGCSESSERCEPEPAVAVEGELTFEECTVYAPVVPDRGELGCAAPPLATPVRGGRYLLLGPPGEWEVTLLGSGESRFFQANFHTFGGDCAPGCMVVGGPVGDRSFITTQVSSEGRLYVDLDSGPVSIQLCPVE